MPIPRKSLFLLGAMTLPVWAVPPSETPASTVQAPATGAGKAPTAGTANKPGAKPAAAVKARPVLLTMAEGLRFDPPRFEAKPGEVLLIQLENADPSHLAHNFVVVKPGMTQEVVQLAMGMGENAMAKAFVPEHPGIIAAGSKVVDPEKKLQVRLTVPTEPGVYGYVCTVPGHGMVMYGAMYVGVPMPALAKDTNIPQMSLEKGLAGGGRRPFVQRMFLPNAGPAAIAVALPGSQNYCFDAGACSLRYVWEGPFLDAAAYWRGNGAAVAEPGDAPWWTGDPFPLRLNDTKLTAGKAKFQGYELVDGIPEFQFQVGKQKIYQRVTSFDKGVEIHFRLPGVNQKVAFVGGTGAFKWSSPEGDFHNGTLEVSAEKSSEFRVRLESKAIPVPAKASATTGHAHPLPVAP
jgi:uncharacterized cupredoxin-like copper-binding protein